MNVKPLLVVVCLGSLVFSRSLYPVPEVEAESFEEEGAVEKIRISSPAFQEGQKIPPKYTCDGDDVSPPLTWESVPQATRSIALLMEDPDAPMGTWVHWVLFNLPGAGRALPEALPAVKELADGGRQGLNDFRRIGYGGPCPPSGVHRYFFKLYAVDTQLALGAGAAKKDLMNAMKGHILAEGELMGRYGR